MKLFIKIFNVIVISVTVYAAIIAGIFVVPRVFGIMPYIVQSGSMEPKIPTGAVAYINQKDRDVDINDIITYRLGSAADIGTGDGIARAEKGTLVTHRLIRFTENGMLITKGDNNDVEDLSPVNPVQVVGTYIFHIPTLGFVMEQVGPKMLKFVMFGVIGLNLANMFLGWAWEDEDEEKKKKAAEKEKQIDSDTAGPEDTTSADTETSEESITEEPEIPAEENV